MLRGQRKTPPNRTATSVCEDVFEPKEFEKHHSMLLC